MNFCFVYFTLLPEIQGFVFKKHLNDCPSSLYWANQSSSHLGLGICRKCKFSGPGSKIVGIGNNPIAFRLCFGVGRWNPHANGTLVSLSSIFLFFFSASGHFQNMLSNQAIAKWTKEASWGRSFLNLSNIIISVNLFAISKDNVSLWTVI